MIESVIDPGFAVEGEKELDTLVYHGMALDKCRVAVTALEVDDLSVLTPCAPWSVADLVSHMIGLNNGFAAAAAGDVNGDAWFEPPLEFDLVAQFCDSADRVSDAFRDCLTRPRDVWLANVRGGVTVSSEAALGFHFVDCVAHSWDLCSSVGIPLHFPDALLRAVKPFIDEIPNGSNRIGEASSFKPAIPAPVNDSLQDRLLYQLGRNPSDWR